MRTHKINTIEELEREQKKLRMGLKITKDAFSKSLGTNRKEIKNYLVNRVVIPAGVVGAGLYAVNKFSGSDESKKVSKENTWLGDIFPLLVNVIQTFLIQKQRQELDEVTDEQNTTTTPPITTPRSSLKSVS